MTWVCFSILVWYGKFDYENPSAESLIDRIMLNLKKRYQGLLFLRDEECFNDITTDDNGA